MDWSQRMNLAIEYIENNLEREIAIDEVAKIAYSSKYHFHRMFFASFNITPAEYIRKRKLTRAAAELVSKDVRVVDVAVKYGYDSPNAFTRAFRKLHGLNPSKVRSSQVKLAAYNRVTFHSQARGKDVLDYCIVEKSAFEILGKSKDFEFDQFVKEGSKFWKNYVGSNDYKLLWDLGNGRLGPVSASSLMSVYFPNEEGNEHAFTDVLGIERTPEIESHKFDTFIVPSATYAEFNCTYQTSMKTNRYIYGEWFAATGYERDGNKPDIAAYFPMPFRPMKDMGIRWWIPVVKRQ